MQNASYIVQKFSENFSKITTINQLIELVKAQEFELEIDFVHRMPSILTWHPAVDSLSGEYKLLVYPKVKVNGKTFSPPKMVGLKSPPSMNDFEGFFIETLKQSISAVEQVWN